VDFIVEVRNQSAEVRNQSLGPYSMAEKTYWRELSPEKMEDGRGVGADPLREVIDGPGVEPSLGHRLLRLVAQFFIDETPLPVCPTAFLAELGGNL
jgi:hypothetical protein